MKHIYKRILSAFLSVVTVFIIIPVIRAEEPQNEVGTHEELKAALESKDLNYISLTNDIVYSFDEYSEFVYKVDGACVLDLNGSKIEVTNNSSLHQSFDDSTLFLIKNGSDLTVIDSSENKTGCISYKGAIIPSPYQTEKNTIGAITSVNGFYVESGAALCLEGVSVTAGNSQSQWLHDAIAFSSGGFNYDDAVVNQVVCGTVVTADNGATLTINGGKYISNGRSRGNTLPNIKGWNEEKPSSVCVRALEGSNVKIYDGIFVADNGADIFDIHSSSNTVIKGGSFKCTPVNNERTADYENRAAFISGEYCGSIKLPISTVEATVRSSFYKNGVPLDTSSTPVIRESNGDTVVLNPSAYISPSITSEGIISSYSAGSSAYLNANYSPYFDEGSTVSYEWYVLLPDSTYKSLPFYEKSLDLKALSSLDGFEFVSDSRYSFGCIVTESFKSTNSYVLTTNSKEFVLTTSNKKIIPSISLTPSSVNSKNEYREGDIPSFKAPSNANYLLNDVKWYDLSSSDDHRVYKIYENREYLAVFTLSAKNGYLFNQDSRVSFLPGGTNLTILPSSDGTTLTVYAYLHTECSHASKRVINDHVKHSIICNICAEILISEPHSFTEWKESESSTELFERECTICSQNETADKTEISENGKEIISSVIIDFGQIYYSNSPKKIIPSLYDTPANSHLTITDHFWTDENGNEFSKFEFNKNYVLTVTLSVNDPTSFELSEDFLAFSMYNCQTEVTVSEGKDTVTVRFTVITLKEIVSSLTLPIVNEEDRLINAIPKTALNVFSLIWAKDGVIIGKYDFKNGIAQNVTDLNDYDDIDFSTHRFDKNSIYTLFVDWDTYPSSSVVYEGKGNVSINASNADEYAILKGFKGTIIAKYDLKPDNSYIPIISVSGITQPSSGASVDKTAVTSHGEYKITDIRWTQNDTPVTSFECDKRYTVYVTITLNSGYKFFGNELRGAVNGLEADVSFNGNTAVISYTFDRTPHVIPNEKVVIFPTCRYDGSITLRCSECSYMNSLTVKKTPHTLTFVPENSQSCKNDGCIEHYLCICCGQYYENTSGEALSIEEVTLKAEGHSLLHNCFDSKNHFSVCIFCGDDSQNSTVHVFSDVQESTDGTSVKLCACGFAFYFTPIQSEIEVGQDENITGINGIPMDKIKTLLFAAAAFLVLIILVILTISAYLILTRKEYKNTLLILNSHNDKDEQTEEDDINESEPE